ncbi:unnamed protein product [Arabidopsis halleri]
MQKLAKIVEMMKLTLTTCLEPTPIKASFLLLLLVLD